MKFLRKSDSIGQSSEVKDLWLATAVEPGTGGSEDIYVNATLTESKGPLLKTKWGQGCGYTDLLSYCPEMSSTSYTCGHFPTGCVATATAQVMRYWQYPNYYYWIIMPKDYHDISNGYDTWEVSQLMYDVGKMVKMSYGCGGSGADLTNLVSYMPSRFKYSSDIRELNFNVSSVINQLNLFQPVILEGWSGTIHEPAKGHAWVCDGYRRYRYAVIKNPDTQYEEIVSSTFSPYYLSMNWGWDGAGNGYYHHDDWGTYDYRKWMVINIHP